MNLHPVSHRPALPKYDNQTTSTQTTDKRTRHASLYIKLAGLAIVLSALALSLAGSTRAKLVRVARASRPAIASRQGPPAQCVGGLGGTVFASGRDVEVEILPGNPSATYTSDLFLVVPNKPTIHFGNSRQAGRKVRIGRVDAGIELVFYIQVRQTGNVFLLGDASRNPDGVPHAIVTCTGDGGADIGFEDLIESESDHSYNDLRLHVKFSPTCGRSDQNRATVDEISNFGSCGGPSTFGNKNAQWGKFGHQAVLESDAGEKLEVVCEGTSIGAFGLYYTKPGGERHRVGWCPFEGGCNSAYFKHSGDSNNNGKPDCFLQTVWRSQDYGENDRPNPFTGVLEDTNSPVFDAAVMTFDVMSNNLSKQDKRYVYRIPPPIACSSGQNPAGRQLSTVTVDPPVGPETDAFFDQVFARFLTLPQGDPMGADPFSFVDFNRDGQLDALDTAIFNAALGTTEGDANYNSAADLDGDDAVTFSDEEIFHDLFNAANGVNNAPVANCKSVTVSANGDCTATVLAADVNDNSFDADGDPLTMTLSPAGPFPVGQTPVTLTVSDGHGGSSSCQATVTVTGGAPSINGASVNPSELWPVNHQMVAVEVGYTLTNGCGAVTSSLEVSSNEPVDGQGDGHSSSDWEVLDAHHVRLRAERSGTGTTRIYTITIRAADGSGNTTMRDVQVRVPHNN